MAADANIFHQYLKAPKSMQEYSDEMNASQLNQQTVQKNALELQAAQQSTQRSNALRDLISTLPTDTAGRVAGLRSARTPEAWAQADALEKQQGEIGKTAAETGNKLADTDAKKIETKIKATGLGFQHLQNVGSPADAHAWAADMYRSGVFSQDQYVQGVARIPTDPAQFEAWKQQTIKGGVSVLDNLKIEHEDLRNKANNETSRANNRDTNATSRANNSATNSVTMRGQNMTDSRARESTAATNGKAPAGYRYLPDGSMQAIPGGPADVKTQALDAQKAAGATDVDSAVATLRDAYDRLQKGGGITSTKNGVLSNISASSSSSGIGQVVGRALGTDNQSARNDIAMTRPALLAALMKATGMSAKQMDSNAELKLWMATATDPQLDVESNRRALDAIERKYITRRGNAPEQPAPVVRAPAKTKSGATVGDW